MAGEVDGARRDVDVHQPVHDPGLPLVSHRSRDLRAACGWSPGGCPRAG